MGFNACTSVVPHTIAVTNENCNQLCSTGYIDHHGNCTGYTKGLLPLVPFKFIDTKLPPPPNPPVCSTCDKGMSNANIHTMHVSINLSDAPVGYEPTVGPSATIRLIYNQKDTGQPSFGVAQTHNFYNVGPQWTLNTVTFVTDDPTASPGTAITRYISGGGYFDYKASNLTYNSGTGAFTMEPQTKGTLYRIPATGAATSYELRFADGSKYVYGLLDGNTGYPRRVFLTQIIDAQGNTATYNYDGTFRLTSLTDATGRNTTFSYTNGSDSFKVTRITDPFGRHADLTYDANGVLTSITDVIGISSSFGYAASYAYLNSLTTPYGTTSFNYYDNPGDNAIVTAYRSVEQTDPLGNTRRVVFRATNTAISSTPSPTPTGMTVAGDYTRNNTFYWDAHVYPLAITKDGSGNVTAENYTYAQLTHWLKNNWGSVSSEIGAVKGALENYVFYNYPGQVSAAVWGTVSLPTAVGRVLDDASSSVNKATYNALGNPLTLTDAKSRVTTLTYAANNIDVLTVKQGADLIATFSNYTTAHKPQTYTDAAGQVWSTAYNSAGQTIYTTNPLNETRFWEYDSYRRITRITIPTSIAFASVVYGTTNTSVATAASFTYDSYDRVRTKTDGQGYVLTYDYDSLDRVTRITYPDASHDDYDWTFQSGPNVGTPSLDLRKATDRLGRVTTYSYDANRRLTAVTEPLTASTTRTTTYSYYENGALKDQTDANGNVTHFTIDAESRPTTKTYAYGTAAAKTETLLYENTTSRLKSLTDALSQVKTYAYELDGRVKTMTYTAAVNATPNVTINWDANYPRPTSIVDGTGTNNYAYKAVGTACAPPTTTTNCGATQLDYIDNATFANDKRTFTYDRLGRPTTAAIVTGGGDDTYAYDILGRVTTHGSPLGTFTYGYLGNTGQINSRSVTVGSITTSSAWGYDTNTNDRRLISITNSGVTRNYGLSYLIPGGGGASSPYDIQSITDTAAGTHPWLTQTHTFGYDYADRLLTANQTTPGNNAYGYDKLDNTSTATISGSGTVNPTYNANNQIATWGTNTYTMDANGNTLSGDGTKTYKWDAENRLIEIDYVGGTNKTVFGYDGMSHRITQAETVSGTTTTMRYLWCGSSICQSRTSADVVTARYHPEGEYIVTGTKKYVYMPDQLGSVRDVIDATTGTRVAAIDYGPYGTRTRTNGSVMPGYQYAGLFYHAKSGLMLATYRAIDGATGRWLNRDPIKEAGGINLYGYVGEQPTKYIDPQGDILQFLVPGIISAGINFGIQMGANFYANGGNLGLAFKCVNWTSVGVAGLVGMFAPGLGAVGGAGFSWLIGGGNATEVIRNFTLYAFLGVPYKFGLDQLFGSHRIGGDCECTESNAGLSAAIHHATF
jgi:RHS repeat-associated protein